MRGFDDAIGPVIDEVSNSLGGTSTEAGQTDVGTIDNSINENNVLASLASGGLILSMSQTLADEAKIDPKRVGGVRIVIGQMEIMVVDWLDLLILLVKINQKTKF